MEQKIGEKFWTVPEETLVPATSEQSHYFYQCNAVNREKEIIFETSGSYKLSKPAL